MFILFWKELFLKGTQAQKNKIKCIFINIEVGLWSFFLVYIHKKMTQMAPLALQVADPILAHTSVIY